jgi:hypothetical protein
MGIRARPKKTKRKWKMEQLVFDAEYESANYQYGGSQVRRNLGANSANSTFSPNIFLPSFRISLRFITIGIILSFPLTIIMSPLL